MPFSWQSFGFPGKRGRVEEQRGMNWKRSLIFFLLCLPVAAQPTLSRLRPVVRSAFGNQMRYCTVVPYKNTAFAAACEVASQARGGQPVHWAVYEYVGGRWSLVFTFTSTVDADEESARLDQLFARYRFSGQMRQKLMYGSENRL